jgi:hypothetical protein
LWATGEPLPPEARRVTMTASVPRTLSALQVVEVDCLLENRRTSFLVSAAPNPVYLSYRWFRRRDGALVQEQEGPRSRLPKAVAPGESVHCKFTLVAPAAEGEFLLRATLVQEFVAWFDDLDGTNGWSAWVRIGRRPAAVRSRLQTWIGARLTRSG